MQTKGKYNPKDIAEYSDLINATNDVFSDALSKGIKDNVIPSHMMTSLENDVFVFSALKTHAQLFEASRQLLTDDGKVKSFQQFSQDVEKIKKEYNQSYLQAEYNFAVASAQQAANWAGIEENGDRYNLQYRTAGDDRVRDDHAALNRTTLPSSDPFWNSYYPPNGWNCRCTAVEVLKDKYSVSDSEKAIEKGNKATMKIGKDGKNRMEIFRFNPGKEKVVFPPNHPYYPKGCDGDVSKLKGMTGIFLAANKGNCGVKKEANNLFDFPKKEKVGKGTVAKHRLVKETDSDFKALTDSASHFAKQYGDEVRLLPKFNTPLKNDIYKRVYADLKDTKYWGKCPDLWRNGMYYEHEGFITNKPKNAFRNMMRNGLKQSSYLILEDCGVTDRYALNNIISRVKQGVSIDEVWIKNGKDLRILYKKTEAQ